MFCQASKPVKSSVPSGAEMDDLLGRVDEILARLKAKIASSPKFPHADRISELDVRLAGLKLPLADGDAPPGKIPMRDGKVDEAAWGRKPEDERRGLWETLRAAFDELLCFNKDELACGWKWFALFACILVLAVGFYHVIHAYKFFQTTLNTPDAADVWEQARKLEIRLAEIKANNQKKPSQANTELANLKRALARLACQTVEGDKPGAEVGGSPEPRKAEAQKKDEKATGAEPKHVKCPPGQKEPVFLPFETARLLGTLSAEIGKDDPSAHQTYQDFAKRLRADLDSLTTAYFWTTPPRRWYELAWWALFGTLVGLLFYMAGSLGQGIFKSEEVFMFVAEVLIAPLVVPVVFFLFAYAEIPGFVPSEASLTVNLGVAFILGFAIRRTVGLLDTIKKRFFPDPAPAGGKASS